MSEDTSEQMNTEAFAENAIIVNITHPEWGTWRVIKSPTPSEEWYHIRGESGNVVMHKCETHFWRLVEAEQSA